MCSVISNTVKPNECFNIFFSGHYSEEDLSAQELIDFSPIYRGLHIAHVLGRSSTFETYYRTERTKQARLVLQPPTNMVKSGESL